MSLPKFWMGIFCLIMFAFSQMVQAGESRAAVSRSYSSNSGQRLSNEDRRIEMNTRIDEAQAELNSRIDDARVASGAPYVDYNRQRGGYYDRREVRPVCPPRVVVSRPVYCPPPVVVIVSPQRCEAPIIFPRGCYDYRHRKSFGIFGWLSFGIGYR